MPNSCESFSASQLPGSNGMETHSVGVFGKHAVRSYGIKIRLVVLNEIEPLSCAACIENGIGRRPTRGHDRMSVHHSRTNVGNLAGKSVVFASNGFIVFLIATVRIVEIDSIDIAPVMQILMIR